MFRNLASLALVFTASLPLVAQDADFIITDATVLTVDAKFSVAEAVAIRDGKIVAIGEDEAVLKLKGPKTTVIDADGKTVLPGLYDSHVHTAGAAVRHAAGDVPAFRSLEDAFAFIKKEAERKPMGEWIILRYAFPTRLKEARFPTIAELDAVAPNHPVLYHAGPAGMVNTAALKISGITKDTPHPKNGMVVKDPATGEPTGMIRNAYGVLKQMPREGDLLTPAKKRTALKEMFAAYNAHGLTSVAERNGSQGTLDAYKELRDAGELTVRINFATGFSSSGTAAEIASRLEKLGEPTGSGDDWIRKGPLKMFLDGGMLNGTAYMRQPWPASPTYQVTETDYRGLLFIDPEQLKIVATEAAKKKWQMTAHCAGEAAMDHLLDAYEFANRTVPIKSLRFCITHANFPSKHNLERCKELGVVADVQPAWLYKDGATLFKELGPARARWFQPYKSWLEYTTVGGGSDHMLGIDPLDSTNPWSPWLGIGTAVTRALERGGVHQPSERLNREQAIRLYTINSAYICHEEKLKGSLEVGKFGDLIMIDRDIRTCPPGEIRGTKVLLTVVGGKVVYEAKP